MLIFDHSDCNRVKFSYLFLITPSAIELNSVTYFCHSECNRVKFRYLFLVTLSEIGLESGSYLPSMASCYFSEIK